MTPVQASEQGVTDTRALYAAAYQLLTGNKPRDAAVLFRLMLHIAPVDERAWLGLGACHEAIEQLDVAGQLYAMGSTAAGSTRCLIAAARVFSKRGLEDEADNTYDSAIEAAFEQEQLELASVARLEREQLHVR